MIKPGEWTLKSSIESALKNAGLNVLVMEIETTNSLHEYGVFSVGADSIEVRHRFGSDGFSNRVKIIKLDHIISVGWVSLQS